MNSEAKTLTLKALKLENFKSVKASSEDFDGKNGSYSGPNGVGKTTRGDALGFLLFGKDLLGRSSADDFKPRDKDGKVLENCTVAVEGHFTLDGKPLVLRRELKEVWSEVRGTDERKLSHSTKCKLRGIPCTITEYNSEIEKAFGVTLEELEWLINPLAFNSIPSKGDKSGWKRRREVILSMCGELAASAVIDHANLTAEVDEEVVSLEKLRVPLQEYSIDQVRKIASDELRLAKKDRSEIPGLINECRALVHEVPAIDHGKKVAKLQADVQALREKKAQLSAGGAIADAQVELRNIEAEMQQIVNRLNSGGNPLREKALADRRLIQETINDAELDIRKRTTSIAATTQELSDLKARYERLNTERARLKSEFEAIEARVFAYKEFVADGVCKTCGNPLREEQIEEERSMFDTGRDTALESFNGSKGRQLEECMTARKANLAQRETVIAKIREIEGYEEGKDKIAGTLGIAQKEFEEAKAILELRKQRLDAVVVPEATVADPHADTEWLHKDALKTEVRDNISRLRESNESAATALDLEIATTSDALKTAQEDAASFERNKDADARIAAHETREKDLSVQIADLDETLFLCQMFEKTWVSLMEEQINSKFSFVQWKLFNILVNGGLEQCATAMVEGQPYDSGLNTGARILAGVDICNALQAHFGFFPPIIIDGAESLTEPIKTDAQYIALKVAAPSGTGRDAKKIKFEVIG